MNSPSLKQFGDARILAGETCLVVDLEACTGMDSTFMGTLAGMATRLSSLGGGSLQIADAGMRNGRSLEDLGLDYLLEIDPPNTIWRKEITEVRLSLTPLETTPADLIQRAKHVLEAHEVLSEMNDKNAVIFENVVDLLKQDLADKIDLSNDPSPS